MQKDVLDASSGSSSIRVPADIDMAFYLLWLNIPTTCLPTHLLETKFLLHTSSPTPLTIPFVSAPPPLSYSFTACQSSSIYPSRSNPILGVRYQSRVHFQEWDMYRRHLLQPKRVYLNDLYPRTTPLIPREIKDHPALQIPENSS